MLPRPSRYAFTLLAALAAAAASAPCPAFADDMPENAARAEALFKEASKLYLKKQWKEAEDGFLAAFEMNPTYDVAANLGHTQYRLGKYPEAAQHLAFALKAWPLIGDPKPKTLAEERMKELRTLVGALTISVSSNQALIFVDGKPVGKSPLDGEVFVAPGVHQVEARLDGTTPTSQSVSVDKGAARALRLALAVADKPAEVGPGIGTAGKAGGGSPVGPGMPNQEALGANKGVLIAGGVTAGAAAVVGGVLAGVSAAKAADISAQLSALRRSGGAYPWRAGGKRDCAAINETLGAHDQLARGALVAFIGATALAGITVAYAFWPPPKKASSSGGPSAGIAYEKSAITIWAKW